MQPVQTVFATALQRSQNGGNLWKALQYPAMVRGRHLQQTRLCPGKGPQPARQSSQPPLIAGLGQSIMRQAMITAGHFSPHLQPAQSTVMTPRRQQPGNNPGQSTGRVAAAGASHFPPLPWHQAQAAPLTTAMTLLNPAQAKSRRTSGVVFLKEKTIATALRSRPSKPR